jgi:hypothetical protein
MKCVTHHHVLVLLQVGTLLPNSAYKHKLGIEGKNQKTIHKVSPLLQRSNFDPTFFFLFHACFV